MGFIKSLIGFLKRFDKEPEVERVGRVLIEEVPPAKKPRQRRPKAEISFKPEFTEIKVKPLKEQPLKTTAPAVLPPEPQLMFEAKPFKPAEAKAEPEVRYVRLAFSPETERIIIRGIATKTIKEAEGIITILWPNGERFSTPDLAAVLNVTTTTARIAIRALIDDKFLDKEGLNAHTKYFIAKKQDPLKPANTKRCACCGIYKPISNFRKCYKNKDEVGAYCKPCDTQIRKINRERQEQKEKKREALKYKVDGQGNILEVQKVKV